MYNLNQTGVIQKFHQNCNRSVDLGGGATGIDVFSNYGNAVAFMCNYGGKWCKNDEFDEAFNMIKASCGDLSGQNTGKSSSTAPFLFLKERKKESLSQMQGFVRIWQWYKS
jgi:hypothetical protein